MKISISYDEVSDILKQKFGVRPNFKRQDNKILNVSYKLSGFVPTVRLAVKVEALRKDVVCFSYDCSMPVSLLIAGAVGHLQNRIPDGVEIDVDCKRVNIYPQSVEKLSHLCEHVFLTDILFTETSIDVSFGLV